MLLVSAVVMTLLEPHAVSRLRSEILVTAAVGGTADLEVASNEAEGGPEAQEPQWVAAAKIYTFCAEPAAICPLPNGPPGRAAPQGLRP